MTITPLSHLLLEKYIKYMKNRNEKLNLSLYSNLPQFLVNVLFCFGENEVSRKIEENLECMPFRLFINVSIFNIQS
jgi:hypothetical protein